MRLVSSLLVWCWILPSGAAAADWSLHPPEVRFDLRTGDYLDGRRKDAPARAPTLAGPPLRFVAVRDQVVTFQVRLSGAPGPRVLALSPLVGPAGHALAGEIFREVAIEVRTPSRAEYVRSLGTGHYPDALIPTSTVVVPDAPGVAVAWVEVWIPPAAPAGQYAGELALPDPVRLEIEVLPLRLSPDDHSALGAVNFGSLQAIAARDPAHLRAWLQMAHAHRLSVELMNVELRRSGDRVDWADFEQRFGAYLDGRAFSAAASYRGPRADQPVRRFVLPLSDHFPSPRTERFLPTDPAAFQAALREFEALAEERDWFRRTRFTLFINKLDEPKTDAALRSLVAWSEILAGARLTDRRHFQFRVDGPFGQHVEGWSDQRIVKELGPVVDLWNVCGGVPWIPWSLLDVRRTEQPDEAIAFYASNTAGEPAIPPLALDSPLIGARAWAWIVRRYQLEGALNWEVHLTGGCVADPQCARGGLNLDATLIYPGEELGLAADTPVASLRLKALRAGAEDIELLELLAARDPDSARALVDLIVPAALGDGQSMGENGTWPQDPEDFTRARRMILDRLSGRSEPFPLLEVRPDAPVLAPSAWLRDPLVWTVLGGLLLSAFFFVHRRWPRNR